MGELTQLWEPHLVELGRAAASSQPPFSDPSLPGAEGAGAFLKTFLFRRRRKFFQSFFIGRKNFGHLGPPSGGGGAAS